jgi:acyl dehydratase
MGETPVDRFRPGGSPASSGWVQITQAMVGQFSAATLDADPMHLSHEWARDKGPFGHTVAFGFQTMSLLTHMLHDALGMDYAVEPSVEGYFLNYGFNRLRLVAPVPVGSRIRGHFSTTACEEDEKARVRLTLDVQVEIEGVDRPALVGEWLALWVPPAAA